MKRGKLIVIEGTDSSGKETQTKILVKRLNSENIPCKTRSFPRYQTPAGRIVGQCYLGKSGIGEGDIAWFGNPDKVDPKIACLYYAGDRRAATPEIERILSSGTNLASDRYYQANQGHQGGKIRTKNGREKMFRWIEKLELELLEIPKEDITIFLYVPTNVAIELRKKRDQKKPIKLDGHEGNIEHLKRAEKAYLELNKMYNWKKIDCAPNNKMRSLEDISNEIYKHVKEII